MRHWLDALLTTDAAQRTRLVQAGLGVLAIGLGGVALLALAVSGLAPWQPVLAWVVVLPAAMLLLFVAIRSGWARRFEDPALTLPQLVVGAAGCALAYALATRARGAFFLVLMVLLMAAMLSATPRQMRWGSVFVVAAMGLAMWRRALASPGPAWPELVHFGLVVTLVPAASVLAARMTAMRQRERRQQQDLEAALARIRELATRDELTGLVNRRHMRELMEQEHQRCIRSGRTFCLAVLDIDHFKSINERQGRGIGDAVLRSVAHEAMRRVRVSDAFARWGGDRFVLLMADARSALARGGADRVRSGIGGVAIALPGGELRVSLSVGLAEHHAGETVEQTLDRAERALAEAKEQGRDRLVVAA
ncbi:MAG: diguanylate cyclase [Rubrivivax sp.]